MKDEIRNFLSVENAEKIALEIISEMSNHSTDETFYTDYIIKKDGTIDNVSNTFFEFDIGQERMPVLHQFKKYLYMDTKESVDALNDEEVANAVILFINHIKTELKNKSEDISVIIKEKIFDDPDSSIFDNGQFTVDSVEVYDYEESVLGRYMLTIFKNNQEPLSNDERFEVLSIINDDALKNNIKTITDDYLSSVVEKYSSMECFKNVKEIGVRSKYLYEGYLRLTVQYHAVEPGKTVNA